MALITKVGGPSNTNTLQMTNRKANTDEVDNIATALAPVQSAAPVSEYISSIDKVLPTSRQPAGASLTPGNINENLTDAMGAPLGNQVNVADKLKSYAGQSLVEQGGTIGMTEYDQMTAKQKEQVSPGGLAEKLTTAPASSATPTVTTPKQEIDYQKLTKIYNSVGGQSKFLALPLDQQQDLMKQAYKTSATASTMQTLTASPTSPAAQAAVKEGIKNVNVNAPFPPQVTAGADTYMGNLYSNSLKQAYSLKKQAAADAASRGLGRENLNEAYNKIDADVTTAFQLAQNEYLNADAQRQFEAKQLDKQQGFAAQEAEKERAFQDIMAKKGFEYEMAKTKFTAEEQIVIEKLKIESSALESEKQRVWESNETLKNYDFQTSMQLSQNDFNAWIQKFDRATQENLLGMKARYDAVESEKNRVFTKKERIATQSWEQIQNLTEIDARKFLQATDLTFNTWKSQFDATTQKDLETMRTAAQSIMQKDAQTFEAFEAIKDRDMQKWLSGQDFNLKEMEQTYGRATALILQGAQEEWQIKQLELQHGYSKEDATQAYQYNLALNDDNQAWEEYMNGKTSEETEKLEKMRIQAMSSESALDRAAVAVQNLSQEKLEILLSNNKIEADKILAGMDIKSREQLQFMQNENEKYISGLDRESQEYMAQLDSKDKYYLLERQLQYNSIMFNKETAVQEKAAAIKAAADKEILQTEMNYKWATQEQDNAIQQAQITGQFTPITGYQKDAQGNLAKDANGKVIPIKGEPVMTLAAASQMAEINMEMTKQMGYLVKMVDNMPQAVLDASGQKIKTLDEKKWNDTLIQQGIENKQFQDTLDRQKDKDIKDKETSMWGSIFTNVLSGVGGAVFGKAGQAVGTAIGGAVTNLLSGGETEEAGTNYATDPTWNSMKTGINSLLGG